MNYSHAELVEIVRARVADIAVIDIADVPADMPLRPTLESIELLELQFQLERLLKLKLNIGGLVPKDIKTDADGGMAREYTDLLRERCPFLMVDRLPERPTLEDVSALLTSDAVARYVEFVAACSAGAPPRPA